MGHGVHPTALVFFVFLVSFALNSALRSSGSSKCAGSYGSSYKAGRIKKPRGLDLGAL